MKGSGLLSVLPVVGNVVDSIAGGIARRKQRKHEFRMAEYAYKKDLEMWNRQNVYNAPSAQMERLRQAGLNPNLVYGQGVQGATGQASQMPKYQQVRPKYGTDPGGLQTAVAQYQDLRMKDAQVDYLKEQALLNQERQATESIKQHGMAYDNAVKHRNADLAFHLQKYSQQFADLHLRRDLQNLERQIKENKIKQLDLDWYYFNKLARPIGDAFKIIPGIGSFFRKGRLGKGGMPRKLPLNYNKFK